MLVKYTIEIIKKDMRKLHIYSLVFGAMLAMLSVDVKAQQEPLYTQYMFNTMSVNPAYTGTEDALNAVFLSRLQWTGFEGAPRTYSFAAHTPFTQYDMGIGIALVADKLGPVNNFYLNVNYAYQVMVTDDLKLSMGIKGGIYNYHVGLDGLLLDGSPLDPSFQGQVEKKFQPNLGAGLYLYDDRLYAGISVPKLFQSDISQEQAAEDALAVLKRHYFVMAGYMFDINDEFKIRPSFISKFVDGAPPSTDISAQVLYQEKYWLGATYRIGDALAFMANIQATKELMVGYSYDFSVSNLGSYNSGSHEILISYSYDGLFGKKRSRRR